MVLSRSDTKENGLGIAVNYYTNFSHEENRKIISSSTGLSLNFLKINLALNDIVLVGCF